MVMGFQRKSMVIEGVVQDENQMDGGGLPVSMRDEKILQALYAFDYAQSEGRVVRL